MYMSLCRLSEDRASAGAHATRTAGTGLYGHGHFVHSSVT